MKWVAKIALWFAFNLRFYYTWSRLVRVFLNFKYGDTTIPPMQNIDELIGTIRRMKWRPDPWWQLWDAIGTAEATFARFKKGEHVGDCDEFAVFCADRLIEMNSRKAPTFGRSLLGVYVLSVPYMKMNGKLGGHNVCAFRYAQDNGAKVWGYVSNWDGGTPVLGQWATLHGLIKDVAVKGNANEVLAWSLVMYYDLRVVRHGWGFKVG